MQIICHISGDIQHYRKHYRDLIKRLSSCPQPECRCPERLNYHGTYSRGLIIDLFPEVNCCYSRHPLIVNGTKADNSIPILRFLCKKCKQTVSCLPTFAVPFKHYSSDSICACLHEIYQLQHPIERISEDNRAIPVRTVREWQKQWQINTPVLFQTIPKVFGYTPVNSANCRRHEPFVFAALATFAFPPGIPEERQRYCKSFDTVQAAFGKRRIGLFRPLLPIDDSS